MHYWNLLPDGTGIDLPANSSTSNEVIQQPRILPRPAGLPKRGAEQYLTMKHRVLNTLGMPDADGTSHA